MGNWCFELLSLPIINIIFGIILWKNSSKDMNVRIGFVSTYFMKNEEMKKFTREYYGKLSWKIGWGLAIFTVILQILFQSCSNDVRSVVIVALGLIEIVVEICSMILLRRELKKRFREDGSRREEIQ